MRRTILTFVLGMFATVALLVHAGGDVCTQLGMKLAAAEHHYSFVSTPDIEAIAHAESVPAARTTGTARRR